jgi:hypothetical protein
MPDHILINLSGEVTDIFAHRFVVKTEAGKILADLGPKGAEQVTLREGDKVTLSGEMKPSELKIHTIEKGHGPKIVIEHKKPQPHHDHHQPHHHPREHEDADPKHALKTAAANGFAIVGSPRRKPKHFEILGKDSAGDFVELHIELDGALRKTRPVGKADPKWAAELRNYS